MSKSDLLPEGECLRRAIVWLSENRPITSKTINDAAIRFDLTPLEEDFLLCRFLPSEKKEH